MDASGIKSRQVNDSFSNIQRSKRASHITINCNKSRRVPGMGGQLNLSVSWFHTELQRSASVRAVLIDDSAPMLSFENLSSSQI
jgi:hypothetical protein